MDAVKSYLYDRIFIYFLLFITTLVVWAVIQKLSALKLEDVSDITVKAMPTSIRNRNTIPDYEYFQSVPANPEEY